LITAADLRETTMLSDRTLKRLYRQINRQYFFGKLPSRTIVHYTRMPGELGRMEYCGLARPEISINKRMHITPSQAVMTLCHEMAHLYVICKHGKRGLRVEHGPIFQREMLRLAKAGAFASHW
jgi:SprT-like family